MDTEDAVYSLLDSNPKMLKELTKAVGSSRPKVAAALSKLQKKGKARQILFRKEFSTNSREKKWKQTVTGWVKATAETSVERTRERVTHCRDLLKVYRKWYRSSLSISGPYSYGSFHFGIYVIGLPDADEYYKEARVDLQCFPAVYRSYLKAQDWISRSNRFSNSIVKSMGKALDKVMEKKGLAEHYKGGSESHRCYFQETVIVYLIVKRIAEGNKYKTPQIEFKDGTIRAPMERFTLAEGIKREEAKGLLQVFNNLPAKLGEVMPDSDFFGKLESKVKALQDDFATANAAHEDFRKRLLDETIKPLKIKLRIPNGGKCHLCRLLQEVISLH